ncbi:MAG TPA: AMP-binding protein [Desulfobaccales bacterium]
MRQPEFEAMDREELELLQLERLQSTLTRAYRQVKFYRQQFDRLGVRLDAIRSLSDLSRLPFTTRQDLSENYPYGLFAVPLRDIVRIQSSPGTTERPLVVGYTSQDVKLWMELLARLYAASGVTREDILQIILPPGLANWRRDLQAGAEHLGASVIPAATLSFAKQLMVMRDYKTSVLVSTPSLARHLLTVMARMDLTPAELSLKSALLVAAPLPGEVRREIEAGFQIRAATAYGITEVMGPGLAFSCGQGKGLHLSEDHFYPEIVDPETGAAVPPGAPGELVITTLSTVAFPLVRFRSGDLTSLTPEPCPCGRTLVRLGEITGRTDPIFSVGGIKLHPDQITLLLQEVMGGAAPRYRYRVVTEEGLEGLEIDLSMREGFFSDEIKTLEGLCRQARRHLQENLGIEVRISLREVGEDD